MPERRPPSLDYLVDPETMRLSVCIPAYVATATQGNLLARCLQSVIRQRFDGFEIVVSDDSPTDGVRELLDQLSCDTIAYTRNNRTRGTAFNTNNAVDHARGKFIKIMNQDDFFVDEDALAGMSNALGSNYWVLSAFIHHNTETGEFFRPLLPSIIGDGKCLLNGVNTIGCPSVALFQRAHVDESMRYMMDCELWYRLLSEYGQPSIDPTIRVAIGVGEHSLSSEWKHQKTERMDYDINYCHQKFNVLRPI
jgi:glycosyltransferase involved in cell wall biosynthesis